MAVDQSLANLKRAIEMRIERQRNGLKDSESQLKAVDDLIAAQAAMVLPPGKR